jgi:hypothetical protein
MSYVEMEKKEAFSGLLNRAFKVLKINTKLDPFLSNKILKFGLAFTEAKYIFHSI